MSPALLYRVIIVVFSYKEKQTLDNIRERETYTRVSVLVWGGISLSRRTYLYLLPHGTLNAQRSESTNWILLLVRKLVQLAIPLFCKQVMPALTLFVMCTNFLKKLQSQ
ncbi:hypothetical protein AVEN_255133-1 [Araneus ventricosus]|uniref:Uncharacterized protein n=1 Tax=Araneus ventricosus TaxID=182803 RepID=A0A4Y2B9S2_ARAVE|nr:hypothetical protein AVEN_255133-1 [Araneus ventricosus]